MRIAGFTGMKVGQFGRYCLAHDDRTRSAEAVYDSGILARPPAGVSWRSVFGRHVGGVDNVLDADSESVQCANRTASAPKIVNRPSRGTHQALVNISEGTYLRLAGRKSMKQRFDQFDRLDLAAQ